MWTFESCFFIFFIFISLNSDCVVASLNIPYTQSQNKFNLQTTVDLIPGVTITFIHFGAHANC